MNSSPFFSIVLPTYGRHRHITPTIDAVLQQTFPDFELIVVGDGCADDTETAVRAFRSDKIAWHNLARNSGSQSFPNNAGIRHSRGQWICYIGHDDIWAPEHLESLRRTIAATDNLDFVVGGCVYHGPKGSDIYYVTGLFDDPDAAGRHFFPPSSIAHRRDVTVRIGEWPDPRAIKAPVDAEFLLRAAGAGHRFASTRTITVHKFAAGHRYLSYLRPSGDEQRELLRNLQGSPGIDLEHIVRTSKRHDHFMAARYVDYSVYPVGFAFEQNRQNKGLSRPSLQPCPGRLVIEQTDESRALDWYGVEWEGKRYRWSGPNPRPKVLVPFTGGRARVSLEVIASRPGAMPELISLSVEERPTECAVEHGSGGRFTLIAAIDLYATDYTVLTLDTPAMFRPHESGASADRRSLGIAMSDMIIEPL